MHPTDTIAAVATGWGASRYGLIRVSGPGVRALLGALCRPAPSLAGTISRAGLLLSGSLAVPILVLRSDAPRSFTGEDTAELVLPGNPVVLERVLARLTSQPAVREAGPGEFSARAFLNGKLTLSQAEGIAATIAAQSDAELAAAESLLNGQRGRVHRVWADTLARLLALVEAGIDFADQEDVVPIPPVQLVAALHRLEAELNEHLGARHGDEQPVPTPRAVLVGPPNAGKSTLFNALLGRRRAVVSAVAGTTRDALAERLSLAEPGNPDLAVELVDLPGVDEAAGGTIDVQAQLQARQEVDRADILVVCDPTGASRLEQRLPVRRQQIIRIRTKADLPLAAPAASSADIGSETAPAALPPIPVCALDGWNLGTLRRALADAAFGGRPGLAAAGPLLPRHRRMLVAASSHIRAAVQLIDPARRSLANPEVVATELRSGLDALAELNGDITPDDIIGRIFATFCIGK